MDEVNFFILFLCFSESFSSVSLPHWADWQLNTRGKSSGGETIPGAKIETFAFFKSCEQNAKIVWKQDYKHCYQETDAYDDLLRLSVKESYRTLPRKYTWPNFLFAERNIWLFTSWHLLLRKTLGGFRFVLNKLPHYDLVLKLDDDLEIRFLH